MAKLVLDQVGNVVKPVTQYVPTITLWNRLEGRPRAENFERALKAEIRDPLWMLSKQWQTGEFRGEDAGSAIMAKVHIKTTALTKYQSAVDKSSVFDKEVPLEVKVENQEIPFRIGDQEISLDLRLLMGRQWLKLMARESLNFKVDYIKKYAFTLPRPDDKDDVQRSAHQEVWQSFAAVSNVLKEATQTDPVEELRPDDKQRNCMDGYQLYAYLAEDPTNHAYDGIAAINTVALQDQIDTLAVKFVNWFEALYYQPIKEKNPSWKPAYLEYQFACSAPENGDEKVFVADEYYHGHLDWYNLDIHNEKESLAEPDNPVPASSVQNELTLSFLPSPVTFGGMPNNRWWTLEDWKTNLGNISPSTTDINQLMVLDFGLNYANDWFMLPFTLPVGSISKVEGLMVTNVFGEKIWVEPAGGGGDEDWERWSMFHLNIRGKEDVPADLSVLLLPALPKSHEGKPLEEVYFLRDEVANMVWAVETRIPLANGSSKHGKEAGMETRSKFRQLFAEEATGAPPPPLVPTEAKIKYRVVNTVPEHWIPFIPVHKDDDKREIQLQRAAMPRVLEEMPDGAVPKKIEPRTSMLREGLDQENRVAYYLNEEEVPKAGIKGYKAFQRTRWKNGKVFTWIGFKKHTGRGEGRSGLAFDQIIPKISRKEEETP